MNMADRELVSNTLEEVSGSISVLRETLGNKVSEYKNMSGTDSPSSSDSSSDSDSTDSESSSSEEETSAVVCDSEDDDLSSVLFEGEGESYDYILKVAERCHCLFEEAQSMYSEYLELESKAVEKVRRKDRQARRPAQKRKQAQKRKKIPNAKRERKSSDKSIVYSGSDEDEKSDDQASMSSGDELMFGELLAGAPSGNHIDISSTNASIQQYMPIKINPELTEYVMLPGGKALEVKRS